MPAALVVQKEQLPPVQAGLNESKELLDTFNLTWLDEPGQPDDCSYPKNDESIEDYSFGDEGLANFLSIVNNTVTNECDINAIIEDICKESPAEEEEEYTLMELKTFAEQTTNKEPDSNVDLFTDFTATDMHPATTPPSQSLPSRSFKSASDKTPPGKPQKKPRKQTKQAAASFKFNIIRTSTTSSSSSSSSSDAARSDPQPSDIPKLTKCLAQINSITAQASVAASSATAHKTAANALNREQDFNTQIKTILETQHQIRPLDLIDTLDNIVFTSVSADEKKSKSEPVRKPTKPKVKEVEKGKAKKRNPSKRKEPLPKTSEKEPPAKMVRMEPLQVNEKEPATLKAPTTATNTELVSAVENGLVKANEQPETSKEANAMMLEPVKARDEPVIVTKEPSKSELTNVKEKELGKPKEMEPPQTQKEPGMVKENSIKSGTTKIKKKLPNAKMKKLAKAKEMDPAGDKEKPAIANEPLIAESTDTNENELTNSMKEPAKAKEETSRAKEELAITKEEPLKAEPTSAKKKLKNAKMKELAKAKKNKPANAKKKESLLSCIKESIIARPFHGFTKRDLLRSKRARK